MNTPTVYTTRSHWRKYDEMCRMFHLTVTGDMFMGETRDEMRALIARDNALNNIPLRNWDIASMHLIGRKHDLNVDGEHTGRMVGASLAEAVCCYKHLATAWAGVDVVLCDTYQEVMQARP